MQKNISISFFKYTLYLDKSEKVVENKLCGWKPKKSLILSKIKKIQTQN